MNISDKDLLRFYTNLSKKAAETNDLESLLIFLLKDLLRLIKAKSGSILLFSQQENRLRLYRSVPHPVENTPRSLSVDEGISGVVFQTGNPIRVENISTVKNDFILARNDKAGSFLSLPLKVAGKPIGVVNINRACKQKGFSALEEKSIMPIVGQISGLIEKARLLDEIERRKKEMELLYELVQILFSGSEAPDFFLSFLKRLEKFFHITRSAIIRFALDDRKFEDFEIIAARNLKKPQIKAITKKILDNAQNSVQSIPVAPALPNEAPISLQYTEHAKEMDFFCFPLPTSQGSTIRHFFLVSSPKTSNDLSQALETHRLLSLISRQIRVAVERQEMLNQIKVDQEILIDNAYQNRCYLEISKELASTLDPHNVLQKSFEQFAILLPFSSIAILMFDESEDRYQIIFQSYGPVKPSYIRQVKKNVLDTVLEFPMDPPISEKGVRLNPFSPQNPNAKSVANYKEWSTFPIILGERGLGLIHLVNRGDTPIRAKEMDVTFQFTGIFITSIRNAIIHRRTEKLAYTDPLTGLFNHRFFQETLQNEFVRAKRYGPPLSLMIMDIDHFKKFNDTYGHLIGDEVLQHAARIFEHSVRDKIDVVARYGGEEFAVVLPNTLLKGALLFGERIRKELESSRVTKESGDLSVTLSIGVACTQGNNFKKPSELIEAADNALYEAKEGGRNRVKSFVKKKK